MSVNCFSCRFTSDSMFPTCRFSCRARKFSCRYRRTSVSVYVLVEASPTCEPIRTPHIGLHVVRCGTPERHPTSFWIILGLLRAHAIFRPLLSFFESFWAAPGPRPSLDPFFAFFFILGIPRAKARPFLDQF